jgi:hypothetical protein
VREGNDPLRIAESHMGLFLYPQTTFLESSQQINAEVADLINNKVSLKNP